MAKNKMGSQRRSMMLNNDYSAPSNLPRNNIDREYPQVDYLEQGDYPDYLSAVDGSMNNSVRGIRKQKQSNKNRY